MLLQICNAKIVHFILVVIPDRTHREPVVAIATARSAEVVAAEVHAGSVAHIVGRGRPLVAVAHIVNNRAPAVACRRQKHRSCSLHLSPLGDGVVIAVPAITACGVDARGSNIQHFFIQRNDVGWDGCVLSGLYVTFFSFLLLY